MFPEKKNFIVLGDSFSYIHLNRVPILVSVVCTVCLTTLNSTLSKVLVINIWWIWNGVKCWMLYPATWMQKLMKSTKTLVMVVGGRYEIWSRKRRKNVAKPNHLMKVLCFRNWVFVRYVWLAFVRYVWLPFARYVWLPSRLIGLYQHDIQTYL